MFNMHVDDEDLIREQIDYYRKRAPEYDEIATNAPEHLRPFGSDLDAALTAFAPHGRILEIACGTGRRTGYLLNKASAVVALDSSPEVIAIARNKFGDHPQLRFIQADIFTWEPDDQYDVVFFSFWLCHVPPERFEAFWDLVDRALKPAGTVYFEDEFDNAFEDEFHPHPSVPLVRRETGDGSTFRVVKVFWQPRELQEKLGKLGWDVDIHTAGPFFWAEARRATERA